MADASPEVRLACAETLGRISAGLGDEVVAALERAASDPDPEVSRAAKRVLREMGRTEVE